MEDMVIYKRITKEEYEKGYISYTSTWLKERIIRERIRRRLEKL